MSLASHLPGSLFATAMYNFDSSRFAAAPRDTRKEGWTESWGARGKDLDDNSRWSLDDESIAHSLATPHPQLPLVLKQYRPAWLEQVVLRMAGISHVVVNSSHCSSEATGPLPYLRDHKEASQPPILVGRHHPSNIAKTSPLCQNSILEYLRKDRMVDLDKVLLKKEQNSSSKCFINLIQSELQPILLYLRYEDFDAWEQVYREQYIRASSGNSKSWFNALHGRFQAYLERVNARRQSLEFGRNLTPQHAIQRAREAYHALEMELSKHNEKAFLLGTQAPSLVDAVLWAHLAEALCDVHLVVVLADCPNLVTFFQHVYETYFTKKQGDWDVWNHRQNMQNAFQKLPLADQPKKLLVSGFKDAIDLMQSLSLRNNDLQDVLNTVKTKRSTEPWPDPTSEVDTLMYRWRMGEDFSKKEEGNSADSQDNPTRKKLIRDQIRNDQIWISGVVGVSAIAILLLQGAGTSGGVVAS